MKASARRLLTTSPDLVLEIKIRLLRSPSYFTLGNLTVASSPASIHLRIVHVETPTAAAAHRRMRTVLEAQHAEHARLKKAGHILPQVFFREVADGRVGQKHPKVITSFNKACKAACRAAACPGRIPHDLRRTAVRNFVRNGIPERVAMQPTGHKTPSVFQRYNITSGSDLRDAVLKIDRAAGR